VEQGVRAMCSEGDEMERFCFNYPGVTVGDK